MSNGTSNQELVDGQGTSFPNSLLTEDNTHIDGSNTTHGFHVDRHLIQSASQVDTDLTSLGLDVYNQDEFEDGVMAQLDEALTKEEQERFHKILHKELKDIKETLAIQNQDLKKCEDRLSFLLKQPTETTRIKKEKIEVLKKKDHVLKQIDRLKKQQNSIHFKLNATTSHALVTQQPEVESDSTQLLEEALGLNSTAKETETERKIRLGEMTPFGTAVNVRRVSMTSQSSTATNMTDFERFLMNQGKQASDKSNKSRKRQLSEASESKSTKVTIVHNPAFDPNIKLPPNKCHQNYFDLHDKRSYRPYEKDYSKLKSKRRRMFSNMKHNFSEDQELSHEEYSDDSDGQATDDPDYLLVSDELAETNESPKKVLTSKGKSRKLRSSSKDASDDDCTFDLGAIKERSGVKKKKDTSFARVFDDGSMQHYKARLKALKLSRLKEKQRKIIEGQVESSEESDMEVDDKFKVPAVIWNKLYHYQKTCVKWLWELHTQQCGGIVGDEMGLGKTIQIIAFLAGLRHSQVIDRGAEAMYSGLGPTLIVCPATVLHQWVREFHKWWPAVRVAVLHNTGSVKAANRTRLIRELAECHGILITSYSSVVLQQDYLLRYSWHYIILDEGHKIRNPDAKVTLACKQFRTCHRLILSGSPMQNNLKELWSLFDFVFPGKLGTLPAFMTHFSVPIVQGGYANATQVQVTTAYKCACLLRDTISPYLLRRMKADVQSSLSLPKKNEQVLFCRLTPHQRQVYQEYLDSKECEQILRGNFMVFPGLITLRKICNHPDLSTGGPRVFEPELANCDNPELTFGHWERSGKMIVVESLLSLWQKQGHRVLLFTQGQQMLDILERYIQERHYTYLRMDGSTNIGSRQPMISMFNEDSRYFVFLLTTRVGGLGVNLTGADRVLIFDPDWNPSTDTQARERAWRIGQTRAVTIYRLLTAGSIEEKIYHRQIFKQFLTNRVLKDPKQRRFFKSNDLFELFSLGSDKSTSTETSALFAGTGSDVTVKSRKPARNRFDVLKESKKSSDDYDIDISGSNKDELDVSEDKIEQMRNLAKMLSKKISEGMKDEASSQDQSTNGEEKTVVSQPEASVSAQDRESKPLAQVTAADTVPPTGEKESLTTNDIKKVKKRKKEDRKSKAHKKDKKKRKKDAKFEGERIRNLVRLGDYQQGETKDDHKKNSQDDDYVLHKLFKKSGVHSAMQHDVIMQASDPDFALVEVEAQRVAREAAMALKNSRSQCSSARSGRPTWTGASGVKTKPRFGQKKLQQKLEDVKEPDGTRQAPSMSAAEAHFDGTSAGLTSTSTETASLSSTELLSRMKARSFRPPSSSSEEEEDNPWTRKDKVSETLTLDPNYLSLATDLRNFVAYGASLLGRASSQEILDHFQERVPKEESAKFKFLLKQLCLLNKKEGLGLWTLKPEFR